MLPNGWKQSNLSSSVEQTMKLGSTLAPLLEPGTILALEGPLGAGKTAFIKGVVQGLGGNPLEVSSPTFNLMHTYSLPNACVHHFDLYRLKTAHDFLLSGFMDFVLSSAIICIEWPETIQSFLPDQKTLFLTFSYQEDNQREIFFQ